MSAALELLESPREIAAVVGRQSVLASGEEPQSTADQIRRAVAGGEVWGYTTRPELLFEEINVSGGRALDARPGLLAAVEAIEAGLASVLVVVYYDRLARSLMTTERVIERVEAVGGRVIALDLGVISHKTAAQWQAATYAMVGAEGYRRMIRERTLHAMERAIGEGKPNWPIMPPGLRKIETEDGPRVEPDPETGELVLKAYKLRDQGISKSDIREALAADGLELSYSQVETLLRRELYTGVLRWGDKAKGTYVENLAFCEPIVPRDLFERVQGKRAKRGPVVKSERLLARLRVLRCSTCGGGMGYETTSTSYPVYRCKSRRDDCSRKVSIACRFAEEAVLEVVEAILRERELKGSASLDPEREAARLEADRYAELFASGQRGAMALGTLEEPETQAELAELKAKRDEARERENRLASLVTGPTATVLADDLAGAPDEIKRDLIADLIERVVVSPGKRGRPTVAETRARIDVQAFGAESLS